MAFTLAQAAWYGKLRVTESQNLNWQAQKGGANNYARTILYYFSDLILKVSVNPMDHPTMSQLNCRDQFFHRSWDAHFCDVLYV